MQRQAKKTEEINHLSSSLSKLIKEKCGKGPETCLTIVRNEYILFYLKKFTTPMEDILLQGGHIYLIQQLRQLVVQSMYAEINAIILEILDKRVAAYYQDWNFDKETGLIVAQTVYDGYPISVGGHHHLISLVKEIVGDIQKQPKQMNCIKLTPHVYVIEALQLLSPFEASLFKQGYRELLFENEVQFKEIMWSKKVELENALGRQIEDIFLQWDYEADKCLICIILNKDSISE